MKILLQVFCLILFHLLLIKCSLSNEDIIKEALKAIYDNELSKCKELLLHLLDYDKDYLDAIQLLGTCYLKSKEYDKAVEYMHQAVILNDWKEPNLIANYVEALRGIKKFNEARNIAHQGLIIHNNSEQLLFNLATVEYDDYQYEKAKELFINVINISNKIEAWYKLINMVLGVNNFIEAEKLAENAIELFPNDFYIYYLIGTSKHLQSKLEEALSWYLKGYEINPNYYHLKSQIGAVYQGLGLAYDALQFYEKIRPFRDNDAGARNNYGALLGIMNRREEEYYWLDQALQIDPNMTHALINMAGNRQDEGLIEEAELYLSRVQYVSEKPHLVNLRKSLLLSPVNPSWLSMIGERNKLELNIKKLLFNLVENPNFKKEKIDNTLDRIHFFVAYHGINDRYLQELVVTAYSKIIDNFNYVIPSLTQSLPILQSSSPIDVIESKIRVAFISKFFGLFEPHGMLLDGIMKYLPRKYFEVIVLIVPSTDGKPVSPNIFDATKFVYQISLNHEDSVEKIASLNLDILIFADTMSEPLNHFLAHNRLAKIQIAFWGNPITSASKHIDYFISADCMEHPFRNRMLIEDEPYSEQVILLDGQGIWYYMPESPEEALIKVNMVDAVSQIQEYKRKDFNISDDWFVYFLPQSVFKIHPLYDNVLSDILKDNTNSHIVVTGGRRPLWTEIYLKRLNSSLGPLSNRLHVINRVSSEKFLKLISIADVILHPFPFDGSRTSADALVAGKPFITLPTEYLRGRMGSAFYRTMNLPQLVARNISEYVMIAKKLNSDKDFYNEIIEKINKRLYLIWEDMSVPFEWSKFLMKVVGFSPIGWNDFIAQSGRNIKNETILRDIRAVNFKNFDNEFNELSLLVNGVAVLETHLTSNDIPRIFNNWVGVNGRGGMRKYDEFIIDTFENNSSSLSQIRSLIKSGNLHDAYLIAESLSHQPVYNSDPLFLLEFGSLQMFRANYNLAIELCGKSVAIKSTLVLGYACVGVSSIYINDETNALLSLETGYKLQRNLQQDTKSFQSIFTLSTSGLEMTLMQAYLTFKKYQKCSHMFTVISNTTSIEDGAAYLAVFAVIDWSQEGLSELALLEKHMLNQGLFKLYSDRESLEGIFISEIRRLQRNYDHILTQAVHCISEHLAIDERNVLFGQLSEILAKVETSGRQYNYQQNFDGAILITQYFESSNALKQKGVEEALRRNLLNPLIKNVILLNEEYYDFTNYKNNNKIIQIKLGRRLMFSDAFGFANDNLTGSYVVLANSDIYFDESLSSLGKADKRNTTNTLIALSKWTNDNNGALTLQLRVDSQDAWIFQAPINETIINLANFFLGIPRCDNRIAEIFHISGYRVINPAYSIRAIEIEDKSKDYSLYSVNGSFIGDGRNVFISNTFF